jgi:hypothetical protein
MPVPKGGAPVPVPPVKIDGPEKTSGLPGDKNEPGTLARGKIEDGAAGGINVAQGDPKVRGQGQGPAPVPPVGTPSAVGSPPITVPEPAERPRPTPVEQGAVKYDVRTYRCNEQDSSFKALSKKFYMSERYERALLFYNRTHPLVADEVRIDPPRLKAGTAVFVPPLEILEQRYPDVIPGLSAQRSAAAPRGETPGAAVPAVPVAVTPPAGERPVPSAGAPGTIVRANASAAGGPKNYRVATGGEPMYLIAQRTLGNAQRWHEIYRLNPRLDPELPLREGTVVLLPADARIP